VSFPILSQQNKCLDRDANAPPTSFLRRGVAQWAIEVVLISLRKARLPQDIEELLESRQVLLKLRIPDIAVAERWGGLTEPTDSICSPLLFATEATDCGEVCNTVRFVTFQTSVLRLMSQSSARCAVCGSGRLQ
jgi:hypothetical protein